MSVATIELRVSVESVDGPQQLAERVFRFAPAAVLPNGQRQTVNLTQGAFTALTVPTGAKLLIVFLTTTGESLVLKGVSGDGATITLSPATFPLGLPLVVPLGATPSVGILNNGAADERVEVLFL